MGDTGTRTSGRPWLRWAFLLLGLGLAVLVLLILGFLDDGERADDGSALPCVHFRSAAVATFGGAADAETVRRTLAEIASQSADATPEVRTAARRMSEAAGGDPSTLVLRSQEMATACAEAGH